MLNTAIGACVITRVPSFTNCLWGIVARSLEQLGFPGRARYLAPGCRGILPEVWEVKPRSAAVEAMCLDRCLRVAARGRPCRGPFGQDLGGICFVAHTLYRIRYQTALKSSPCLISLSESKGSWAGRFGVRDLCYVLCPCCGVQAFWNMIHLFDVLL